MNNISLRQGKTWRRLKFSYGLNGYISARGVFLSAFFRHFLEFFPGVEGIDHLKQGTCRHPGRESGEGEESGTGGFASGTSGKTAGEKIRLGHGIGTGIGDGLREGAGTGKTVAQDLKGLGRFQCFRGRQN